MPEFVKVGTIAEFEEGALNQREVDGKKVLVVKANGRIFAVSEACTHAGLPLSAGYVDGDSVVCPFHESVFNLEDGEPTDGPAGAPLTVYSVRIDGEDVFVGQ